jgi:signal transduction histidine kinase
MSSDLSRFRHELRNAMNALKLCTSALEVVNDPAERVEWLDSIETAADNCSTAIEKFHGGNLDEESDESEADDPAAVADA